MAPSSRSHTKRSGTLRGYGPPFWRDRMFWIASALSLFVGLLVLIVSFVVLSTPGTGAGWAWTIGLLVLSTWIAFVLLSLGLNTARSIERGSLEADAARGDRYEAHGRRAGKVVGTGLAKVTGRSKATRTTGAGSPSTDSPAPESKATFDDAARSLGKMVGRRLGERKDRS